MNNQIHNRKLADCDPTFQAKIQGLAQAFNRPVEYIWRRWQQYEQVSDVLGQSALLSEFEQSLEHIA